MRRVANLYRTTVGKKFVMAVTGYLLILFVIAHLLGNLKIYYGPEKYNHYAEWLRVTGAPVFAYGQALWLARFVLLGAVVLHILSAIQLTLISWDARQVGYLFHKPIAFSYASYTMRWGGVVIFAFVVFHLLDLTWGSTHPGFVKGSVYHNVVSGFQRWPVSAAYILAMIPLALHMYHGLWSGFQTLGANNPGYSTWRRPLALAIALAIFVGNVSIPIAVLTGVLEDVSAR